MTFLTVYNIFVACKYIILAQNWIF